jgi:EmrB/QacA subfamily drug resistance transporter
VAALAQLLMLIGTTTTSIALPSIWADLRLHADDLDSMPVASGLAFGALLLLGGHLADLLGRTRTLSIGLAGDALACAIGGSAPSFGVLIGACVLQGASAALLSSAVLSLVSTSFTDPKERGRAFGIYAALVGGGTAIGLCVNVWLIDSLSWRWCLYAGIPLAVMAVIGAATLVHDSPVRTPARLDVPGLLLGSVGLAALVYGFGQAKSHGWTDFLVVVLLVGGLALLLLFAWWQTRTTNPLLPPYVFQDRNRFGSCLALALIGMGLFVQHLVLTRYLQGVGALGYAPFQIGVALLPMAGAVLIASTQVSARLYHRLAPRNIIVPGLALAAIGLALLTGLDTDSAYATQVLPGTLLIGFGLGLAFVPLFATATGGIAPQDSGGTSAMVNMAQTSGGWAASPLFGGILASVVSAQLDRMSGAPEGLTKAVEQGVLLSRQNLPPAMSDVVRETDRAVLGGYSVILWWAVGLTLLAGLLVGLLVTAEAPRGGRGSR